MAPISYIPKQSKELTNDEIKRECSRSGDEQRRVPDYGAVGYSFAFHNP